MKISFSINSYDKDGDIIEEGLFLYLGDYVIIKVDKNNGIDDIIKQLENIKKEIAENY